MTTRHLIQQRITRALAEWEPRIRVEAVDVEPDPVDPQAALATITYKLIATQTRERVSSPLRWPSMREAAHATEIPDT